MSAEDYGYSSYDDMIAHAAHHGGGIDMDANAVEWVASELSALRQRVAELEAAQAADYWKGQYDQLASAVAELHEFEPLEAAQAVVTPNNCRHCHKAAEKMREAAAMSSINRWGRNPIGRTAMVFYLQEVYNIACEDIASDIRALPLPTCGDCNPLAPSQHDADMLEAWHERM